MIETTYRQIMVSFGVLEKLAGLSLRGTSIMLFARMLKAVGTEVEFFRQTNDAIVRKLGVEMEDGNFQVQADRMGEFNTEINELLDMGVTINLAPIPVDALTGINEGGDDLTVSDIILIDYIFEDG